MKTKTMVWVAIAVVALGGAWYYFANSSTGTLTESPVATTTTATATTTPVKTTATKQSAPVKKPAAATTKVVGLGTASYLIGLKQALICSAKTTTGYSRSGTMYVADGKMRANFVNSSMIDDGSHLYVWMKGAIKGIVLSAVSSASGSAAATNGGIDLATDLSFACNPWTVDASVFIPPASVSFFSSL